MADEADDAKAFADAFADDAVARHRLRTAPRLLSVTSPMLCVECGENIPTERIAAVPTTERCVRCQVLRDARSN